MSPLGEQFLVGLFSSFLWLYPRSLIHTNVARALRELEKEGLIKCITSPAKMGKIFAYKRRKEIREEVMRMRL